jgi:hypothetical protein
MITRVAFIAIGIMLVLFVPRSWSKRQFVAWAVFASVVFFFDYSFALVATKAQATHATVNVYADAEVIRLDNERAAHAANIIDLQAQYAAAAKRETMDQINANIEAERALAVRADEARAARVRELTRSVERSSGITSAEIFTAIPDAARDGRYIQLAIFGLIFVGLQLIIATSIDNGVKRAAVLMPAAPTATITPDDIDRYVRLTWFRVEQNTDTHALPRDSYIAYFKKINEPLDEKVYDMINLQAHESGLINDDDVIRVKDTALAAARLKELLCSK